MLFSKNSTTWVLFTGLWGLGALLLWQLPLLGRVAWWVLNPALYAGFIYEAAQLSQGRALMLEHLFVGLTDSSKRRQLLTLGVITLAGYAFLFIITMIGPSVATVVEPLFQAREATASGVLTIAINLFLRIVIFVMILSLVSMALFYACPAIMLEEDREAFEAMMHSFETCMGNWRTFGAFALMFLGFSVLAMLALGLGFLVLMPVTFCAAYVSYESMHRRPQPL